MKIKRNGQEFELTPQELSAAYREQEKIYRLEDVKNHLEWENEAESKDAYGVIVTDHMLELFEADDMKEKILAEYDKIFTCEEAENGLWYNAIGNTVRELEKSADEEVKAAIDQMAKDGFITEEERVGMRECERLVRKASAFVYRLECAAPVAVHAAGENFRLIRYEGLDSWSRPVYSMADGTLVVDTDNRSWSFPKLCTKLGNAFDGEPDTPLNVLRPDDFYGFYPERVTR